MSEDITQVATGVVDNRSLADELRDARIEHATRRVADELRDVRAQLAAIRGEIGRLDDAITGAMRARECDDGDVQHAAAQLISVATLRLARLRARAQHAEQLDGQLSREWLRLVLIGIPWNP